MDRLGTSRMVLATILLTACGGGDSTSPDQQSGSLGVSLSASSIGVSAGGSGSVTVNVTRNGGFAGAVTMQMEGVPAGVTIGFAPQSLPAAVSTTTLTINVAASATAGRYLMTVRATGSGVAEAGAQLWLDIQDFTLRAARDTVSIVQGAAGQLDVMVTRVSGFAGGVTFSLEGAPAGVTGSFTPNPVTADRSTLALQVGSAVATGRYQLTVRGTATGPSPHATTFVLEVLSAAVPGFTITLAPSALTITTGGASGAATVTIRRTGGFTGAVTLAMQGHPTGVTATPPPPVTDSVATVSFAAAVGTQPGTYPVIVGATAGGYPAREATLQLTVQEAPGFTLSLSNNSISTAPGAAAQTVTVQIARFGGFADTVRLAMTGLPAGFTTTFNPTATTGNALLSVGVTTANPGVYTGTVHATATGFPERTAVLTVTVTAGSDVMWRFCSPNPSPVFFAFQDGVSAYVPVTAGGDGSYLTGVGSGRGAAVFVLPGVPDTATDAATSPSPAALANAAAGAEAGYTTYMYYGSVAELQQVAASYCPASGTGPLKTVYGSVAGVPAGTAWTVSLDGASSIGLPGAATSFTLQNVRSGAHDLVTARAPYTGTQVLANAFIIRRSLEPGDGSTLPVLDFAGAEAFAPAAGTLTVSGIPTGAEAEGALGFTTANGTSALIGQLDSLTSATRTVAGVPAARLLAGDLHTAAARVETGIPQVELSSTLYRAQVGAWTLDVATPPAAPTVDVYAVSPIVRLRARGVIGATGSAYGGLVHASFIQAGAQRATVVFQGRGYIGTTQNFEIRTGGYNTLPGWSEATYGFLAGALTNYRVELLGSSYGFVPADGSVLRSMSISGHITP